MPRELSWDVPRRCRKLGQRSDTQAALRLWGSKESLQVFPPSSSAFARSEGGSEVVHLELYPTEGSFVPELRGNLTYFSAISYGWGGSRLRLSFEQMSLARIYAPNQ